MIYLDNSATTRATDLAAETVNKYLTGLFFNPSSAYKPALDTEKSINEARENLAKAMGVSAGDIIFTSGGTEANNLAVFGAYRAKKGKIITSRIEHPSVYEPFCALQKQGANVACLGADSNGCVSLDELERELTRDTTFVSIMHVNNETGAINNMEKIGEIIKKTAPDAIFHMDGVQAFNKLPYKKLCCDMYSISAHKFHGPKGVGALFVKSAAPFEALQLGGGQEQNKRSGTLNTAGIMGMDAALCDYMQNQGDYIKHMLALKIRLTQNINSIKDVYINGPEPGLGAPHIVNASFMGVKSEVLLQGLCEKGIMVSAGSACSARKKGKNRVLNAMGIVGQRQEGALRFSFCPYNTIQEIDFTAQALIEAVGFLRKYKRR